MIIKATPLEGLLLIQPDVYGDDRGFFTETWNFKRYRELGLDRHFVQDNLSFSTRGILRGLHFQNPGPQGKLVHVLQGEVFDVAVDIRTNSSTFGQWYGVTLSADNHLQLFIPEGFAHGFCVTSKSALFAYKCTSPYAPEHESILIWNDSDIGIDWPLTNPQLSPKDLAGRRLKEFDSQSLAF